jgi:hypothetical protein
MMSVEVTVVPQCRVGLAPTLLDGPPAEVRRRWASPRDGWCRGWRWSGPPALGAPGRQPQTGPALAGEVWCGRRTCRTAGLSAIGAAAILAETGDPCRFATARALVKHAGLAPREMVIEVASSVSCSSQAAMTLVRTGAELPNSDRRPRAVGVGHSAMLLT